MRKKINHPVSGKLVFFLYNLHKKYQEYTLTAMKKDELTTNIRGRKNKMCNMQKG